MESSIKQINKPIFIVGSGRSGSTILTWCLGQHPNNVPQEESNWLGPFAIDAAVSYQRGSIRGERGQLSANFIQREEFLSHFGQAINELIVSHRSKFEDVNRRQQAGWYPPPFRISRVADEPKTRWVDGTPEYSFYICGLRKLFPQALFIHIFRDVTSVVRSMLHFHHVSEQSLVANVQEAYSYWLRTVSNCLLAERAYGPSVVFRIRHSDLVGAPEDTLRSIFSFLSEPFAPECLEPLAQRINSSNVPADFQIDDRGTDPSLVQQAMRLSREVEESSQPLETSAAAIEEIESDFDERVQFVANLPKEFRKAQELILTQQTKNQRISARAARLAMEVEKKSAIIRHLRDGRKHSNWLRSVLGALPKTFQRRSKKMRKTDLKEIDRPTASFTNSNQSTDVDGRT